MVSAGDSVHVLSSRSAGDFTARSTSTAAAAAAAALFRLHFFFVFAFVCVLTRPESEKFRQICFYIYCKLCHGLSGITRNYAKLTHSRARTYTPTDF